ncbi:Prenylated Rab acceptor protein 1 [Coniosporium tulheliwenetii]|uniref:Prenylated Rab acceptor protein 1 n=1 Tax=Coniosporium tulheliwenetii TaxID=3383036 RepID=A0ACC2YI77_9PEZI|nr:Prenylated Rab acceptor protein 1 [Cladosporium sp. JES 115]
MRLTALAISLALIAASLSLASPTLPLRAREVVTVTRTVAGPAATSNDWASGATPDFPIHPSCNATERAQLERAFAETIKLAQHAKEHILRFGNSSSFYTKYFGNAPTAEPIGWFDKVVSADRGGMWFRCDNPDGNCEQEGWGGHWRGENATLETVICPLSYSTRWSLEAMCGNGYTVAGGATNAYWASDIVHRLFHVYNIGEGTIEHYADDYAACLALATSNPEEAVRNSDTLLYFALDVYAWDVALPGEGCTGNAPEESSSAAATTSATSLASSSAVATSSSVSAEAASVTVSPTLAGVQTTTYAIHMPME